MRLQGYLYLRVRTTGLLSSSGTFYFQESERILPRQRNSTIISSGRLKRALQKALYRPASFMKGVLLPFMDYEDNTLKMAEILASVILKTSIPNSHAAAALFEILNKEYSGPLNIIVKVFVEKKLALPGLVIRKVVEWFMGFKGKGLEGMPVLWFQTILSFSKLYKSRIIRTSISRRSKKLETVGKEAF